jgi:hypothetical protein
MIILPQTKTHTLPNKRPQCAKRVVSVFVRGEFIIHLSLLNSIGKSFSECEVLCVAITVFNTKRTNKGGNFKKIISCCFHVSVCVFLFVAK